MKEIIVKQQLMFLELRGIKEIKNGLAFGSSGLFTPAKQAKFNLTRLKVKKNKVLLARTSFLRKNLRFYLMS